MGEDFRIASSIFISTRILELCFFFKMGNKHTLINSSSKAILSLEAIKNRKFALFVTEKKNKFWEVVLSLPSQWRVGLLIQQSRVGIHCE